MDFNKIEAEERHIFKLWTLCRVCGQAGDKLQYCLDNYGKVLEEVYGIDLAADDPAIHPQMVCQNCRFILQQFTKKNLKGKGKVPQPQAGQLPDLYTFRQHGGECDVCDRASGLLPKRKRCSDATETETPPKVARPETEQPGEDAVTESSAVGDRGNLEDLESSQESSRANVLLHAIQGTIEVNPNENVEEEVEESTKTEQEGFTKYVYLNMIRRFKARGMKEAKTLESVDINRITQKNFASTFLTCCLCKRLPLKPVSTECKHIFCEGCISDWLNFGNVCPKCEEVIVELSDATEQLKHLYVLLDASCTYESNGCQARLTPYDINEHEKFCPHGAKGKSKQGESSSENEVAEGAPEPRSRSDEAGQKPPTRKKKALRFLTPRMASRRMEKLRNLINKKCKEDREDTIDVLFYLLRTSLHAAGDKRFKTVDRLWHKKKLPAAKKAPRRMPLPPRPRPRPNRRKGTPRKRRRVMRKDELSTDEAFIISGLEEEEEHEEDLQKDKTWQPPAAFGRRPQSREEDKGEEDNAEKNEAGDGGENGEEQANSPQDAEKEAFTEMETAVQEIINYGDVVKQGVLEGNEQPTDIASATAE